MESNLKGLELDMSHLVLESDWILDHCFHILTRHLSLDFDLNPLRPLKVLRP